jgi:O-antigen ligase
MAETRLAARAAPDVLRHLAPFVAWATAAIGLGAIVGFAAVVLPPLAAFGIVAMVAVLLLWVMPETPLVYPALIRKTFYVMLIVNLCVPYYYMVQFGSLPWISARRIVAFSLIMPFLLAVASSSEVRRRIASRLLASPLILICAVGYLVMAILSLPDSLLPGDSLSALVDALLEWYVPFVAMIYVVRDEKDIVRVLKVICLCALLNSALGVVEFYFKHRFLVDVFPKGMLAALAQSNPMLQSLVDGTASYRNGIFRATSTFLVPLSFGEFEIIVIPIAIFFAVHRQGLFERCLGWTVAISGMVGILVSGSRGGYVGFLASTAAFVAIWSIRKALNHRTSLAPALVGTMGAISSVIVFALVLFWPRAHNMVLGGGAEQASTEARWDQWQAALPLIKSNPITGHGFVTGGFDIGSSIDSYVISLLVETGVPGLVFFAGIVCVPIWYGLRAYLTDLSESGAIAGTLACSFIAFTLYRLVLSQRENHFLIYCLLGIVVVLNYGYQMKRAKEPRSLRAQRGTYSRPGERGLKTA